MPPLVPHGGGWGKQSWGGSGWGGMTLAPGGAFLFASAYAPAENIIRLLFTQVPYYSEIYDTYDASDVTHYGVEVVSGTGGYDGYDTRPVDPVEVVISTEEANALDVYLDRPMSPYPSQYTITAENLANAGLTSPLPSLSATVYGVYRQLQPMLEDVALPTRDLANPQTLSSVSASGVAIALPPSAPLGVYVVDGSGDYAFDAGIQCVKKRILRRGVTDKGAFAHLPWTYGVGLLSACKQLAIPHKRARYAADYQAQILQEPEVVSASVTPLQDPQTPAIVHFVILAQTRSGSTLSFDHPIDIIRGVSLADPSQ
jgi:hypothetical protein